METNTGGIDDFVRVQKIKKKKQIFIVELYFNWIDRGISSLTKRIYNRSISYFFPTNDEILRLD